MLTTTNGLAYAAGRSCCWAITDGAWMCALQNLGSFLQSPSDACAALGKDRGWRSSRKKSAARSTRARPEQSTAGRGRATSFDGFRRCFFARGRRCFAAAAVISRSFGIFLFLKGEGGGPPGQRARAANSSGLSYSALAGACVHYYLNAGLPPRPPLPLSPVTKSASLLPDPEASESVAMFWPT